MNATTRARASAIEARRKLMAELKTVIDDAGGLCEHDATGVPATSAYVKDNPWVAVGVGAAAGLLAGLLLSRRR
jgi:ElaB/YqjD/DUF883 family membrane-anchored ribosome-binding protein